MALQDQPYFPLYVNDYVSSKQLNDCSAEAAGILFRLICLMHKSPEYGKLIAPTTLLKQVPKHVPKQVLDEVVEQGNENVALFSAYLCRHMPYSVDEIKRGLSELLDCGILTIEDNILVYSEMLKRLEISQKKSASGRNGGIKTQTKINNKKDISAKAPAKASAKAGAKAIYENEIEYEYDNDNVIDIEIQNTIETILSLWDQKCSFLPKWSEVTKDRKKKLIARDKEIQKAGYSWSELFDAVDDSDFLSGRSEDWKADLDWIVHNSTNWLKIREGKYSNSKYKRGGSRLHNFDPTAPVEHF